MVSIVLWPEAGDTFCVTIGSKLGSNFNAAYY